MSTLLSIARLTASSSVSWSTGPLAAPVVRLVVAGALGAGRGAGYGVGAGCWAHDGAPYRAADRAKADNARRCLIIFFETSTTLRRDTGPRPATSRNLTRPPPEKIPSAGRRRRIHSLGRISEDGDD